MKLNGNMIIELTDVNTGTIERSEESNMITTAVNDLLGLNPMGIFYAASDEYDTHLLWNDTMLPICPNMIGGILLYSEPLTENADNIYPSTQLLPVAFASNDVNATSSVARGSMNLTESVPLENGYRFVWEFTPSQGNGTIAAVALTSSFGGKSVYGDLVDSSSPFLTLKRVTLDNLEQDVLADLYSAVEVDFENGFIYSMRFTDASVILRKRRLPVFTLNLNDRLNDMTCTLIEEQVIPCSTFQFMGSYTPYGGFFDGKDGYWYGFANQGNSSGNATMYWIKIKKEDFTKTEGTWTLSNAHLQTVGSFKVDTYVERMNKAVVRNGYLYVIAYNYAGIYKINLNNSADVTLISFGFTSSNTAMTNASTSANYLVTVNDLIIGYDFLIQPDDTVIQIVGAKRIPYAGTPLFQYKEFITSWGGSYGSNHRSTFLLTPYLATINNLQSAVVKNTDKTMKIIYELTEAEGL